MQDQYITISLFVKCAFVAVKNEQKSQCQTQDTVSKGDIRWDSNGQ